MELLEYMEFLRNVPDELLDNWDNYPILARADIGVIRQGMLASGKFTFREVHRPENIRFDYVPGTVVVQTIDGIVYGFTSGLRQERLLQIAYYENSTLLFHHYQDRKASAKDERAMVNAILDVSAYVVENEIEACFPHTNIMGVGPIYFPSRPVIVVPDCPEILLPDNTAYLNYGVPYP